MKARNRLCILAAAALVATGAHLAKAQSVITQWTFENDSIATNNSPAPSTGSGTADAIGLTNSYNSTTSTNTDDVLAGSTGDTGVNTLSDLTHIWRIRGKSPGNGWSSQAPIGTQGAQFFTSTAGILSGSIGVSFDFYVTNQGEAEMQLDYTTDGTTWTNIPINIPSADNSGGGALTQALNTSDPNTVTGYYSTVTGPSTGGQDWFPKLTATITDPAALNNPNFGIEVVNASTGADVTGASGGAYNNNSGNWRFDNVAISSAPVPEPVGASLLGLAGLGLLNRRRARSK